MRYHECDPSGIVFHAHYQTYADIASFDCLKTVLGSDFSYDDLTDQGIGMVVAESKIRYLLPCRDGDELVVSSFTDHVGTTSLILRFQIFKNDNLAAEVTNRYVWISDETLQPISPPEDVGASFTHYAPAA